MKTRYIHATIYTEAFRFVPGEFTVADGVFAAVREEAAGSEKTAVTKDTADNVIDLHGAYVIPGLIDIHTHGIGGDDFMDADPDALHRMARAYARCGITTFTPASMTAPLETLEKAFTAARSVSDREAGAASFAGINMEGPFFSDAYKGAQQAAYLKQPDSGLFRHLNALCGERIRIVNVAPELDGAIGFIRETAKEAVVSLGHTAADYASAKEAFAAGARHMTHLFNAMPGIHHRAPGPVAAAAETEEISVELIADGVHIHPAVLRLAFHIFGASRVILVSDSIRCTGMPDGAYTLGGQSVTLKEGTVRLSDGTIAGAASDLYQDMLNVIQYGIPKEDAVRAVTYNPARRIGVWEKTGSIAAGKTADFVVCDEHLGRRAVYRMGERTDVSASFL